VHIGGHLPASSTGRIHARFYGQVLTFCRDRRERWPSTDKSTLRERAKPDPQVRGTVIERGEHFAV
jgi:hypothetical protein